MDVCFVKPRMKWQYDPYSDPPLGLLSVAATAREIPDQDVRVSLWDIADEPYRPSADVYAFSASTLEFPQVMALAAEIKAEDERALLIVGGPHFDVFPHDYWMREIHNTPLNVVLRGEGESTIKDLLDRKST